MSFKIEQKIIGLQIDIKHCWTVCKRIQNTITLYKNYTRLLDSKIEQKTIGLQNRTKDYWTAKLNKRLLDCKIEQNTIGLQMKKKTLLDYKVIRTTLSD